MPTPSLARQRRRPASELDDLLTAVGAERDGEAFTVLFDHFGPRVHAQMRPARSGAIRRRRVTQDVMETIWRKAHLYDPRKSAAATWVFHIARNRRIDVRRRSREFSCAAEDFSAIPDPAAARRRLHRRRPAREQRARRARRLAARAGHAGAARLLRGLSHSARSRERMKLPLGTVKSRLRLAFSRLRRFLHDAGVT